MTINPFLNRANGLQGIVSRFDILSFIQLAILLPLFITTFYEKAKRLVLLVSLICFLLLFYSFIYQIPPSIKKDYLQKREVLIQTLPTLKDNLCNNPLVIAQHGEQFLVTFILNVPAQQKFPNQNNYECISWLIRQDNNFEMIDNVEMKKLFKVLTIEEKKKFIEQNPHLLQLFELKQNP